MYNKSLHRFSFITALSTFVLIFIGGLVTSTGSGLAVPDWPTTYGENMFTYPIDKWVGGIKYEHGHRLVASFVGFLTLVLAVWLLIQEKRTWVKGLGLFALAAVIIQGILGGLTVLFLLPTAVSIAHGMLAQIFFCMVSALALVTSRWWVEGISTDKVVGKTFQTLFGVATISVFVQLGFGALLRHTYSGLSIPDFPFAYGQLFPDLSREAISLYNQELITRGIKWAGDKPVEAYQILIHLIHRYWAYVVVGILVYSSVRVWKSASTPSVIRTNGKFLLALIIVQFLLGMFTVLTRKEFIITSLHVAIGALILVTSFITLLQIIRIRWLNNE